MIKKTMLILCVALMVISAFAQEIKVIKNSGAIEQFNLSDINDITFSIQAQNRDQEYLQIHTQNGIYQLSVGDISSTYFNEAGSIVYFQTSGGLIQINISEIDNLIFASELDTAVQINYSGTTASVVNPLEFLGVSVSVSDADVIINSVSDISNLTFVLSGTTNNGMFKIYSDSNFTLVLDEVQITNLDGPAINIQADVEIDVELADGTTSIITDGVTYANPTGVEDQKAAFFSEGQLIFSGGGSLIINGHGNDQHGLGSDDYIVINAGSITVQNATKDGIHTNEGFYQNGGSVNITSNSDGIDAGDGPLNIVGGTLTILSQTDDQSGLKCDSEIQMTGGVVNLTIEGDQSKGLKAVQILLSGGELSIHTSGNVVLEPSGSGYDPSYCVAIKADTLVQLDGCQVDITTTGLAGRGISCDGDINLLSGTLGVNVSGNGSTYTNASGQTDAYHGPCLEAEGDISIVGGTYTLHNSGRGGKAIKASGQMFFGNSVSIPVININTTGQRIVVTSGGGGVYVEAKAISADGSILIANGNFTIYSADDAVKSQASITFNNGTLAVTRSIEGLEAPNLTINNGTITVVSSNDGFNSTMGNESMNDDGSQMNINGGNITVTVSGNDVDALDSNGDITILGGIVRLNYPTQPPSSGIDANGSVTLGGSAYVYLNGVLYYP